MDFDKEKDLLKRYTDGTCSEEEKEQIEAWYLKEIEKSEDPSITDDELEHSKHNIWTQLISEKHPSFRKNRTFLRYAVAASILILFSVGFYFNKRSGLEKINISTVRVNSPITPGGNKAILTLADGTKINLSEAENGVIANQRNATIKKAKDGLLVYEVETNLYQKDIAQIQNKIDIPKGGQYKLILPDGTKVWLNSMTSIKYPSTFSGSERRVELKGEAYFEVAKNEKIPFIVQTSQMEVEVLGTHFNVMSYENETLQEIALLEGSVNVIQKSSGLSKILKPGYLAKINDTQNNISLRKANLESIVAWKNGIFQFDKEDIKTIMKKLERWYDIEVIYEGKIPPDQFVGKISRDTNLDEVLKILSQSKITYRLEGKKIIISS